MARPPRRAAGIVAASLVLTTVTFAAIVLRSGVSAQAIPPVVSTDKTGYLAGETISISGTGFTADEPVTLQVTHAGSVAHADLSHDTFTAIANASGAISATWTLGAGPSEDLAGTSFVLTASRVPSGALAPVAFNRIAVVETTRFDYQPGETAEIIGAGFRPGERVTVQVVHSNALNSGNGHAPFDVTADENGRVTTPWFVDPDDSLDSIFRLTARGAESGLVATSTFTDLLIVTEDDLGPDDPTSGAQTDLSQMSSDPGVPAGAVGITWNWDDTARTGGNSVDACALVDTSSPLPIDGLADFAFCVTAGGNPLAQQTIRLWDCNNTRSDRCAGRQLLATATGTGLLTLPTPFLSSSSASVGPANSDPFAGEGDHNDGNDCTGTDCLTKDTIANVTLQLADVGGASVARLINVCSYPSEEPNSNPSDCVITPLRGTLEIVKVADPDDDTTFTFDASVAALNGDDQWTIIGSGSQTSIVYNTQSAQNDPEPETVTLDLSEAALAGWKLQSASCVITGFTPPETGTSGATGVIGLQIRAGFTTVCTFTNAKPRGSIQIVKNTVGGIAGQSYEFGFTPSGFNGGTAFSLTTSGVNGTQSSTFGNLLVSGTYSVSESSTPTGWSLTSSGCTIDGVATGSPSSIVIQDGKTTICTFTNTEDRNVTRGKIKITKTTDPSSDTTTSFGFTTNYESLGFSLNSTQNNTSGFLNPSSISGTYTVAENIPLPAGWSFSNLSCSAARTAAGDANPTTSSWSINGQGVVITLGAGDTVTCAYTNIKKPVLTLLKTVIKDNGGTALDTAWTLNASGPSSISGVEGVAAVTSAVVNAGTYTLTESNGPNGYTQTNLACQGATVSNTNQITLANGDVATCTFTNDDVAPQLKLVKAVTNDNGGTALANAWDLTATGSGGFTELTPAAADATFRNVTAGVNYALSETGPSGYSPSAWVCVGGTQTNGSITLAVGQTATCTITNDDVAPQLKLVKAVTNDNGGTALANAWDLTATGSGGFTELTPAAADATFRNVTAGVNYALSETGPSGYSPSAWVCVGGTQTNGSITLAVGQTATCTITNDDIAPRLRVVKNLVPTSDTGLFNLQIDGVTAGTGANAGHNGTTGFVNVTAGVQHTVGETAGTDTVLTDYVATVSCTIAGGNPVATNAVTLALNQEATCTITNTKKGMATLLKLTNGEESPTAIWNFTLKGSGLGANGVSDATPPPAVDFGGAKLTPGETYTICETPIAPGWTLEWKVDTNSDGIADTIIPFAPATNTPPLPWTNYSNVYDPNYVSPPGQYTNDTRCVQFKVQAGQTLAFEINNSFPGGDPRTIGYWKNWNTCTSGNQAQTAAANGGPDAGWYILNNLLNFPGYHLGPAGIGGLQLDGVTGNVLTGILTTLPGVPPASADCVAGVRILDKSKITDAKKQANDAAYNMAAQLLAATLNISAGAETCAAAVNAVNEGHALLTSIGFNGTGSYLTKSNNPNYQTANNIAGRLDQYNNGFLCTP